MLIFDIDGCESRIGYVFKDKELLKLSLTHCSYGAEHNVKHNQRLEFLGDAVLENVISFISENNIEKLGLEYIELNLSVAQCIESNLSDKVIAFKYFSNLLYL